MNPSAIRDQADQISNPATTGRHPEAPWGDLPLPTHDFRVVGLNVQGISPKAKTATRKQEQIRELLTQLAPDILCLSETNTAWHLVAGDQRLNVKMKE